MYLFFGHQGNANISVQLYSEYKSQFYSVDYWWSWSRSWSRSRPHFSWSDRRSLFQKVIVIWSRSLFQVIAESDLQIIFRSLFETNSRQFLTSFTQFAKFWTKSEKNSEKFWKVIWKWSENILKMIWKWSESDRKVIGKWSENDRKVI